MTIAPKSLRHRLMLAGACGLALSSVGTTVARADASTAQVNLGVGQESAAQSESVVVKYKARLLKEKNSPSAVTELGKQAIAVTGVTGSAATLLRQAPSVYVYSQGLGDNAPEFTIRGLRGLEIATTLDGVPTQDLEAPGSFYLANNIGAQFTLNQIQGVSLYPGVAYPDKNTFGTIGGTIAYDSKRPTNDFYLDVNGSIGSFGVAKGGFELNTGALDSVFGTGDNALKLLLNYENLQAQGYIDGTSSRENEMEFALDKPYNDGLSKFQWTVIYNTADGLIQNEPVPIPYLQKYGEFSNYPTNLDFGFQRNDYFTTILKDDTYVNDYLSLGLTAFYLYNDNQLETYAAPEILVPSASNGPLSLPYGGGYIHPFVNNFGGFGYPAYLFGPPTPPPLGLYGGGYGGYFYGTGHLYNPYALYPAGSPDCPASYANNVWGGRVNAPCGLNDQITGGHNDTYGIQPRATIIVPEIFGIANTIKVGALIAKETSPAGYEYLGGGPQTPFAPQNAFGDGSGGTEREIFQAYIQDKIDLLDNTLHITPGLTGEGTHSAIKGDDFFGSPNAGFYGPNGLVNGGTNIDKYGYFKATKWDREYLPFANITYDFDKITPQLAGLSVYGSWGTSALFAPVGDFGPNTAGPPPYASIVHLYEGGVKYDTSNLLLRLDYFYQKVDRDFGFFSFQSGPQNGLSEYSNFGQRETKGIEGTASWQVTPEIQLFANGSHLLAKYLTSGDAFDTVAEDQYGTAFKGAPETGIPDVVSTFGVDYSHKNTFLDNDSADIRFQGTYTGHQSTTYDLGGTDYLHVPNFPGLEPLNFTPGSCGTTAPESCAYIRYNQITGATVYDPHGGISPFTVFSLDANYTLPTPQLPVLKHVVFDLNVQNLFDQRYFQYFYKQISPNNCGIIQSGPFKGLPANNYSCTPSYSDAIPGQPFSVTFTVTARF